MYSHDTHSDSTLHTTPRVCITWWVNNVSLLTPLPKVSGCPHFCSTSRQMARGNRSPPPAVSLACVGSRSCSSVHPIISVSPQCEASTEDATRFTAQADISTLLPSTG